MYPGLPLSLQHTQGSAPAEPTGGGALNRAQHAPAGVPRAFSDNAPSWEELAQLVEARSAELQWGMPDMESVRIRF